MPSIQIEEINISIDKTELKKGETQKLKVEILPDDAKDHEVEYISSNSKIATVDSSGNILALKSGTATITVKAKENNVSSSIQIKVFTPVTGIELNTQSIVMEEDDRFIVAPIIVPIDADNQNVIYMCENEEVAVVDNLGNIKAIKEGITKIVVKTEEGEFKSEIEVKVVPKLGEDEVSFDESLKHEQNEIAGWDIEKLTVSDVKEKVQSIYSIKVYDYKENELDDTQSVGTGSKIRLIDENDVIKMEYYIIIYGDVNGDGKINSLDLLVLQRHILEIEKLKGIFIKARQYKQKRSKSFFIRFINYTKAYTNIKIDRPKIVQRINCNKFVGA